MMNHTAFIRRFCWTILLIPFFISCNSEGKNTSIQLAFRDVPESASILLQELSAEQSVIDTLEVDAQKTKVKFSVKIKIPTYYTLQSKGGEIVTLLVHPKDKIIIRAESPKFEKWTLEGSEDSEKIRQLSANLKNTIRQIDSLNNVLISFIDNKNINNIRVLIEMSYNRIINEQRDSTIQFIKNHLGSMVSLYALYQQYPNSNFVLDRKEDITWFEKLDSALYKKYISSSYVQMLHANVTEIKDQLRKAEISSMVSGLGATAPQIELPDPNGNTVKLSSLRGKYVLIDFWAAWCSPCREENPNLVATYEKYASRGFEIFQVSLDRNKKQWLDGIAEDGLGKWKHGCDLKYWDTPVAIEYNVEEIPANFLIDPAGTIIAKNLRGEALPKKLEEIFANAK